MEENVEMPTIDFVDTPTTTTTTTYISSELQSLFHAIKRAGISFDEVKKVFEKFAEVVREDVRAPTEEELFQEIEEYLADLRRKGDAV